MADDLRFTISADNAQALQAIMQLANALQQLANQTQGQAAASTTAAAAMNTLSGGMQRNVTIGAALGSAIGTLAAQYLPQVISGLVGWGKEAVMVAARVETLTGVAHFLGTGVGKSKDEIDALVKALNLQGITVSESTNLINQLIRTQIGLEHATKLASVAQNIASMTGRNSSEVLNGLITAVTKLSPQMLDQYGIIIKNSEAFAAYGKIIKKNGDDLTPMQRQMALLNAIFEQGERVAGVYGVAMEFAGKQMGSFERYVEDAQAELGKNFLPALKLAIGGLTELMKAVREAPEIFLGLATAIGVATTALAVMRGGWIAFAGGIPGVLLALGSLVGFIPSLVAKYKELTGSYVSAREAIDAGTDATWGWLLANKDATKATSEDIAELKSFVEANKDAKGEVGELVKFLNQYIAKHEAALTPLDLHTAALRRWSEEYQRWAEGGRRGPAPTADVDMSMPDMPKIKILKNPFTDEGSALKWVTELRERYNDEVKKGGDSLSYLVGVMEKEHLTAKEVAEEVNRLAGYEAVSESTVKRLAKERETAAKETEKHTKAVAELLDQVRKGPDDVGVLHDAFKRLTEAERADVDVQRQLLPLFDKLIQARGTLTVEERKAYEAALAATAAETAAGGVKLWHLGITKSQIDALKEAGLSEQQIAAKYGVTTDALQQYGTFLDKTKVKIGEVAEVGKEAAQARHEAEMRWAAAHVAMTTEIQKGEQRRVDAKLAGTALVVRQIERQRDAEIQAIQLTQDVSEELKNQRIAQVKEAADVAIWQATHQAEHARQQYEAIRDSGVATAAEIQKAWEEWYAKDRELRDSQLDDWNKGLRDLAASFAQLAQIAGGAFGGIVKEIGVLIGSMAQVGEQSAALDKTLTDIDDNGMTTKNFAELGTSVMGIATGFMQATASGNTFSKTIKGALMGAQVGAQFGGAFGAAVGAAIGGVAGLLRGIFGGPSKQELAGREAAANFTKGLEEGLTKAQKAEVLANVATGASAKWATQMVAIRDAYLAVGRTAAEAEDVVTRLWRAEKEGPEAVKRVMDEVNAVFDEHKQRIADAEEFASTLATTLQEVADSGQLATRELLDMVEQLEAAGQATEEIQAFRQAGFNRAAQGLNQYFQVYLDGNKKWLESDKELGQLRDQEAEIRRKLSTAEGKQREELLRDLAEIKNKIRLVTDEMGEQEKAIDSVRVTSQATADAMGNAIAGIFAGLVQGGASPLEALKQLEPSIKSLGDQLEQSGLKGSAAFMQLANMASMANDMIAGPALEGVAGLGDALVGLHNSGLLTQEMFVGLTNQIAQTFDSLVKQGYDGENALRLMQPSLQKIWELQQDFGYEVDASTQLMLDQGKKAGIVGDQHRSASDKMAKGIERLVELMEAFLKQMGVELPAAASVAQGAITDATTTAASEVEVLQQKIAELDAMLADPNATDEMKDNISAARDVAVARLAEIEAAAAASNAEMSRPIVQSHTIVQTTRHVTINENNPTDESGRRIPFDEWLPGWLAQNRNAGPDDVLGTADDTNDRHRAEEAYSNTPGQRGRARGSPGLMPEWWGDRGSWVKLHGWETVVPRGAEADFMQATMAARGSSLLMPASTVRGSDPVLEELKALRRDLGRGPRGGPDAINLQVNVGGHELERRVIDISQRALNDRRLVTRSDAVRTRR